jgi:Protein of unknown function (DUF3617)
MPFRPSDRTSSGAKARARLQAFALVATCVLCASPALAAPMQPGLWELAITVTVDGKPETVPAARECVMQADIDHATRSLPRPAGKCELSNIQRTAERATYDLVCQQDTVTTQGRADIAFAGDRYRGQVDLMIIGKSGGGMPVTMIINATRVSDCAR